MTVTAMEVAWMPTSVGKTFIVCCAWGFALSLSCLELCRFLSLMTIWRSAMPLLFTIFQLLLCFVSLGTLLTDFFVIRFWRVFPFHRFAVGRSDLCHLPFGIICNVRRSWFSKALWRNPQQSVILSSCHLVYNYGAGGLSMPLRLWSFDELMLSSFVMTMTLRWCWWSSFVG